MSQQPLQFLVKLSKLCNLRCTYCYELEHLSNPDRIEVAQLKRLFSSIGRFLKSPLGERYFPNFVFHGGEPLLLGRGYFSDLLNVQGDELSSRDIKFHNSVQTNLYKLDLELLRFLTSQGFSVGVSFDVFGDNRITSTGGDSFMRVKENILRINDEGIDFGGVAVLTSKNVMRAVDIYDFYNDLGKPCQITPAFWQPYMSPMQLVDVPAQSDVVSAFINIAARQLSSASNSISYPIYDYQMAAIRSIREEPSWHFDPKSDEWCLVVDTNGDLYSYGDAYTMSGAFGNAFSEGFDALLSFGNRKRSIAARKMRVIACKKCQHRDCCNHIAMIESHQSDRNNDGSDNCSCNVARPVIGALIRFFHSNPQAMQTLLLQRLASRFAKVDYL